jgi:hypothetical protein
MVSPVRGDYRRCQAETPLINLFKFAEPALSLWLTEAIWKSFQYCYTDRIKLIEAWFRGEKNSDIVPFQIFSAWGEVWQRWYRHPKSLVPILGQPFVFLPYLPLVLFGMAAIAWRVTYLTR